ncbi:hypothetical protein DFJ58DRAFT_338778 [Suillus subalutaceus]|uniref:uncharacterized protein n=1 Tax=Suillus subalutaceus TaxID=48586 RepID=UPI001B87DA91|nr:uncharacterized protein DFJ58DRAFT_338778 [Suillus subalutaceus]KAG1856698.1 hypothetical protein DFJ58DRAFT_338778 [Suillus subalutaceus]
MASCFTLNLVRHYGTVPRTFASTASRSHENPLGLPFRPPSAPQMPRRGGPIQKRHIEHVKKVIVVASGKGGCGQEHNSSKSCFLPRNAVSSTTSWHT